MDSTASPQSVMPTRLFFICISHLSSTTVQHKRGQALKVIKIFILRFMTTICIQEKGLCIFTKAGCSSMPEEGIVDKLYVFRTNNYLEGISENHRLHEFLQSYQTSTLGMSSISISEETWSCDFSDKSGSHGDWFVSSYPFASKGRHLTLLYKKGRQIVATISDLKCRSFERTIFNTL